MCATELAWDSGHASHPDGVIQVITRLEQDDRHSLPAAAAPVQPASIGQAGAFLRCGDGAEVPDVELTLMLIDLLGTSAPGFSCMVTVLTPKSRGTARLASTDPAAAPFIDPRYYAEATDRKLVVEGLHRTLEMCESPIMRALLGPTQRRDRLGADQKGVPS